MPNLPPGCLIIGRVQVQWTQKSYVSCSFSSGLRDERLGPWALPHRTSLAAHGVNHLPSFFGYEHPCGHWRHKGADCSLGELSLATFGLLR